MYIFYKILCIIHKTVRASREIYAMLLYYAAIYFHCSLFHRHFTGGLGDFSIGAFHTNSIGSDVCAVLQHLAWAQKSREKSNNVVGVIWILEFWGQWIKSRVCHNYIFIRKYLSIFKSSLPGQSCGHYSDDIYKEIIVMKVKWLTFLCVLLMISQGGSRFGTEEAKSHFLSQLMTQCSVTYMHQ